MCRKPMTPKMAALVDEFVKRAASDIVGDDFWVTDLAAIGGQGTCDPRPFIIDRCAPNLPTIDPDDDEMQALKPVIGFVPQARVIFAAMSNQAIDHEILGRLCAGLAHAVDGVIDLHGQLDISIEMEGLIRFPYESLSGATYSHYCTPNFMTWWLNQEEFRMVK
jgi:hypothetical protein